MKITLISPSASRLENFLQTKAQQALSYPETGASVGPFPAGYDHDQYRVLVGRGAEAFAAAREALDEWAMFSLSWVHTFPKPAPIRKGAVVAVIFRVGWIYWFNACRIVYVIDGPGRYGFAYGTLPGHVERGEERFVVEQDEGGQVWYHIAAFSRPGHWLTRLAYPLARRYQRQFVRGSFAAMQEAVHQKTSDAASAHP